jgi:hypothetical protein
MPAGTDGQTNAAPTLSRVSTPNWVRAQNPLSVHDFVYLTVNDSRKNDIAVRIIQLLHPGVNRISCELNYQYGN